MSSEQQSTSSLIADQPLYCANHPKVQTRLRCNRCGKPICIKCARRTPVGFRCPECIHEQQAVYYSATSLDYILAIVIGFILSVVAGYIMSYLGWFFAIFLGPVIGGIVAEAMRQVTRKRRGRWMPLAAVICIALGALLPVSLVLFNFVGVLPSLNTSVLWETIFSLLLNRVNIVYVILAAITAYARLR